MIDYIFNIGLRHKYEQVDPIIHAYRIIIKYKINNNINSITLVILVFNLE